MGCPPTTLKKEALKWLFMSHHISDYLQWIDIWVAACAVSGFSLGRCWPNISFYWAKSPQRSQRTGQNLNYESNTTEVHFNHLSMKIIHHVVYMRTYICTYVRTYVGTVQCKCPPTHSTLCSYVHTCMKGLCNLTSLNLMWASVDAWKVLLAQSAL